ncbi:hypothetical protein [Geodermatophilus sp. URMC 62]|uniref:hypothetical protein n=1 Tax=Geodermatophilus sp. URMC 62 TaxID=3423414 RepID=UPI00406C8EEC
MGDDAGRALVNDLVRLKKAGWKDLAQRPERYDALRGLVTSSIGEGLSTISPTAALDKVERFFTSILRQLPDRRAADAWYLLLGLNTRGNVGTLDHRRVRADAAFRNGKPRKPDTFRRFDEQLLMRLLLEVLGGEKPNAPPAIRGDRQSESRILTVRDFVRMEDVLAAVTDAISQQRFVPAEAALKEILRAPRSSSPSARELRLYATAHFLLGHVYRDRGRLHVRRPAEKNYRLAAAMWAEARETPRQAEAELMTAVLLEMSNQLREALAAYSSLSDDGRLTDRGRFRAILFAGSVLTKLGHGDEAKRRILRAIDYFEQHNTDVVSGYLKLASALLRFEGPDAANEALTEVRLSAAASPLLVVRRELSLAHVLVSQPKTFAEGQEKLRHLGLEAERNDLGHQLSKIQELRRAPHAGLFLRGLD